MFFIVIGHVQPFRGFGGYGNYVYFALDTIGQFDVPFFFVTSGYFLATTIEPGNVTSTVRGIGQKLGSIYVFGRLVSITAMLGLAVFVGASVTSVVTWLGAFSLLDIVYYGHAMAAPLWFLTALFFAIVFVAGFVAIGATRYLLPVAALVHLVGLVGTNYGMLTTVPVPTRDALFFGFFYVALGYTIRSVDWAPETAHSHRYLAGIGLALAIQFLEQYAIGYVLRDNVLGQTIFMTEYTIATVLLVLAVFGFALSNPQWARDTILPWVGRHALGIYLIHVPVMRGLRAMNRVWGPAIGVDVTTSFLWQLLFAPLVYVLSLSIYLALAKVEIIDPNGSHIPGLSRLRTHLQG